MSFYLLQHVSEFARKNAWNYPRSYVRTAFLSVVYCKLLPWNYFLSNEYHSILLDLPIYTESQIWKQLHYLFPHSFCERIFEQVTFAFTISSTEYTTRFFQWKVYFELRVYPINTCLGITNWKHIMFHHETSSDLILFLVPPNGSKSKLARFCSLPDWA